ncbi:MAG: phospho-N-acetylmuramoyl-pentapeptide-transferase [Bacteroidaceae bacterium]|nr:phospho-N-acetylmuramoyl-pentapeptide-transferase [Bacteroidaceae bacterium]MCI6802483.1 phospho-N-acetylmuramoyl-pentapeptide-transferase [Prevotellaceae bacterium]MBQ8710870.1 phospho-N-acetylmuramoyl-pentapeptide-transferase [Bacteroidaceae bacterium]MBR1492814.1 phospho-N-acetylmuramoyl-pentapeptide-transferase [Bacteroidaceae bacterium]MDD6016474.1 phospho-N-acetylmuramoyl-pentapeptide-transferase [Prevotellaceae bacterium]
MLYDLFKYLDGLDIPGAGMFSYVSFRALTSLILSLIISMVAGEYFIKYMRRKKHIEEARDASIDPYGVQKKGVPSMGGVVILAAVLVPALLLGKLSNVYMVLLIATIAFFGLIGFIDDKIKLDGNKDGLSPRLKMLSQLLFGVCVGLTLWLSPDAVVRENVEREIGDKVEVYHMSESRKSTVTTVPFVKSNNIDYYEVFGFIQDGKVKRACGWILFVLVTTFVIAAVSNGANLNDGMDGMCAGNSAIIGVTLGILAYVSGHVQFASYLNVMYIPGTEEVLVFLCAFVGALVGFLWYNAYPAKVFMGDTGSLAIGGVIAVTAIIIHKELLLPIMCGIFLMESVSVMLQVAYAKKGNARGEKWRVFKRAPFHDHYRHRMEDGVKYLIKRPHGLLFESMITTRFWIVTILLAAITIITLKIR